MITHTHDVAVHMCNLIPLSMTKCLKPYIFGLVLKKINSRFLSQKTPYQLCGVIWRLLTQESGVGFFEQGPEILQLQALCHSTW